MKQYAGDYSKQYAGDYSKYMSQGSGDSSSPAATLLVKKDAKGTDGATDATQASSDSSEGGYGNYMKQYAGSYMGGGSAGVDRFPQHCQRLAMTTVLSVTCLLSQSLVAAQILLA